MSGQCYVVHFGEKLKAGSRRMVSSAGFKYDDHDDNEEDYECLTDNKDNTGVSVMNMSHSQMLGKVEYGLPAKI